MMVGQLLRFDPSTMPFELQDMMFVDFSKFVFYALNYLL
jgi:hypothetical protein